MVISHFTYMHFLSKIIILSKINTVKVNVFIGFSKFICIMNGQTVPYLCNYYVVSNTIFKYTKYCFYE